MCVISDEMASNETKDETSSILLLSVLLKYCIIPNVMIGEILNRHGLNVLIVLYKT